MAINSRQKGSRVERVIRDRLRELGFSRVERTAQRSGRTGTADLSGISKVHIEVKGGKVIHYEKALEQAKRDARADRVPIVISRKDRCEPVLHVELKDVIKLAEALLNELKEPSLSQS